MEKTVEETQYIIFTKLSNKNNFNLIINKLWENWAFLPKKVSLSKVYSFQGYKYCFKGISLKNERVPLVYKYVVILNTCFQNSMTKGNWKY